MNVLSFKQAGIAKTARLSYFVFSFVCLVCLFVEKYFIHSLKILKNKYSCCESLRRTHCLSGERMRTILVNHLED